MRNPSDYPNQSPHDAMGESQHPAITPANPTPRFQLESLGADSGPEWQRNMLIYGGLSGERDDEPNLISQMKIRKLRAVIGQLLEAQASALYGGRMAMALIESCDALEFMDKLSELRLSSQRTMEECARLIACGEKEQR